MRRWLIGHRVSIRACTTALEIVGAFLLAGTARVVLGVAITGSPLLARS